MPKFFRKAALFAATFFMLAALQAPALFAQAEITDWKGMEGGAEIPEWVSRLEDLADESQSGKIEWSKKSRRLFKSLGAKKDDALFYSIQEASDLDAAQSAAKSMAKKEAALQSEISNAKGLSVVADFWLEENYGEEIAFTAYAVYKFNSN